MRDVLLLTVDTVSPWALPVQMTKMTKSGWILMTTECVF